MKLAIFDCDGVLADSEILGDRVILDYVGECFPETDFSALKTRMTGVMVRDILHDAESMYAVRFPQDASEQILSRLDKLVGAEVQAVAGAGDALERIAMPKAVASNSTSSHVALLLERIQLAQHFGGRIFGADKVPRPKPAPELYLLAAAQCQASPADCIVVEDSVTGVTAAAAAGMTVLGFLGGSHVRGDHGRHLLAAGAERLVAHMSELPAVIEAYCSA